MDMPTTPETISRRAPEQAATPDATASPGELYLDLLMNCLTRSIFPEQYRPAFEARPTHGRLKQRLYPLLRSLLPSGRYALVERASFKPEAREEGHDWPAEAETMIGLRRLRNLRDCVTDVLRRGVPGDLIETGVWRGGATIFMRAVLKAYGDRSRIVWAADSFEGLPKADPARYPVDTGDRHWRYRQLGVSLDEVKANFSKYGLLDDQVRFLVGWFRDTLPNAPIERLAVMRLDGDMYESTMDALTNLYPKLSVGGYVIIDDYALASCQSAVEDFRKKHGISEPIRPIDWIGAFWQRTA